MSTIFNKKLQKYYSQHINFERILRKRIRSRTNSIAKKTYLIDKAKRVARQRNDPLLPLGGVYGYTVAPNFAYELSSILRSISGSRN